MFFHRKNAAAARTCASATGRGSNPGDTGEVTELAHVGSLGDGPVVPVIPATLAGWSGKSLANTHLAIRQGEADLADTHRDVLPPTAHCEPGQQTPPADGRNPWA